MPGDVEEVPGHGVRGVVDGHRVAVGKASWTHADSRSSWAKSVRRRAGLDGALTIFVDVDGAPVGALLLDDPIRPDAARTIRQLRRDGIRRIVMVTGDREENAQTVGAVIGVDDVLAERTPAEKVEAVRLEHRAGPTIMVGDGINDAPALALADVGVAVGARGATASSEAADVVLTVDRLDRLGEAIVIARRSRRIALQSVVVGIGLSLAAMVVAAFGYLPPVWGAVLQEVIDVAVILNALRALRDTTSASAPQRAGGRARPPVQRRAHDAAPRPRAHPRRRRPARREPSGRIGRASARRAPLPGRGARPARTGRGPRSLPGSRPRARRQRPDRDDEPRARRDQPPHPPPRSRPRRRRPGGPDADDILELRRLLYGLYAILQLHFAQEDEGYLSLAEETDALTP